MPTPLEARLIKENEALHAQNKAQQIENKLLREKIDLLLLLRVFGARSEQLDDAQFMLLLQADEGAKKPQPPTQTPASWRLRSRGGARTTSRSSRADNA